MSFSTDVRRALEQVSLRRLRLGIGRPFPWIQGMRMKAPQGGGYKPTAPAGGVAATSQMTWQEILHRRLTGNFAGMSRSDKTEEAEIELFVGAQHVYYGIGKNSPDFGDYVAVFAPIEDDSLGGRVAPFDTGGIALRHIPLNDPSVDLPLDVVRRHSMSLDSHQEVFRAWITRAFDPPAVYLTDEPAVVPAEPFAPEVSMAGHADVRRWGWEGRLPAVATDARHLRAQRVYFRDDYLARYRRWLTNGSPLGPKAGVAHARFIGHVGRTVLDPYNAMTSDLYKRNFNG
ncbi:hypothetical protein IFT79_13405 [Frigoribacterium sp. CFBP 8759]|uniref:hypothetical protein n=1 Tax=Frigoribacterium sp. CFBP 8759 TaxID=2775283 RepID=UPI001784C266|nr:hypothetical protein [Frigoribacterium sp. CFBP 8759]MBD8486615.1 hypothetical protein [Frigoribacterium sp. CFBP 8759]